MFMVPSKNLMVHVTGPYTPLSGTVCHPCTSSCYDQPIYQI